MSELVTKNCPVCFVDYAIPRAMNDKRLNEGGDWYCPNGHALHFSETKLDKLTRERDRLKQNEAYLEQRNTALREQREAAERRASAARGQVTKLKKRVGNGVCPCCNRTFLDLQRHMATKHAGFTVEETASEPPRVLQ